MLPKETLTVVARRLDARWTCVYRRFPMHTSSNGIRARQGPTQIRARITTSTQEKDLCGNEHAQPATLLFHHAYRTSSPHPTRHWAAWEPFGPYYHASNPIPSLAQKQSDRLSRQAALKNPRPRRHPPIPRRQSQTPTRPAEEQAPWTQPSSARVRQRRRSSPACPSPTNASP